MSRFTDQTTQPAIKRQTNDGPVRNPVYDGFRRFVLDILAEIGVGPGGGGGPSTITAAQISDATASGRAVITSSPADARVALELGTAATKAVGVSGGVAAYDDPRIGAGGGGGGAPSTVTASQISDGSTSGKSVLTGTPAQGRTALAMATVQDDATPPWTTGRTIYDRARVTVGNPADTTWPHFKNKQGEDKLGCVSALTGAIKLPVEADQALDGGNPTIIITAGVMGLVETYSTKQTGVGLFGMARVGVDNGRVWGLNVVTSNVLEAEIRDTTNVAHPAQINGIEIDCGWRQPANPVTGSNLLGIWIPSEFYNGRPDGAADAIRVGRYGDFGWKNFLSGDHGSSDRFAQLGMLKAPEAAGASGSPGLYWISSAGGQKTSGGDTNQYKHTYLDITPGGDMLIRPDFFGGQGRFTVANNDLSQSHSIHPVDGFTGARATLGRIDVTGNASVGGNMTSNSINTGALTCNGMQSNGNVTATGSGNFTNTNTGNITVSGNGSFSSLTYQGTAVQLSPAGSIPGNAKALIVIQ